LGGRELLLSVKRVVINVDECVGRNESALRSHNQGIDLDFDAVSLEEALVQVLDHKGETTALWDAKVFSHLPQLQEVDSLLVIDVDLVDTFWVQLLQSLPRQSANVAVNYHGLTCLTVKLYRQEELLINL